MVLTDGEVWNTDLPFNFIEKETASGDVHVFSLGIGRGACWEGIRTDCLY
jgi:hypothetical protein